jgi:hypothetical protein
LLFVEARATLEEISLKTGLLFVKRIFSVEQVLTVSAG